MGFAPPHSERFIANRTKVEAGRLESIFSNCEQLPRCSLPDAAMRFPPLAASFFVKPELGSGGLNPLEVPA
jgi:hypothetical protein